MEKGVSKLVSSVTKIDEKTVQFVGEQLESIYKIPAVKKAIKKSKKRFLGSYTDTGKSRSIDDVISGEYISKKKRKKLLK